MDKIAEHETDVCMVVVSIHLAKKENGIVIADVKIDF